MTDRPHTVVAETDDVSLAVTGEIDNEPRMLIDTPPRIDPTKIADQLRRLERAVAGTDRRPHTVVAETDDVGIAVTGEIDNEAGMLIDTPAELHTEIADNELAGTAVAVTDRRPHTVVAETDDVGMPSPVRSTTKRGC